MDIHGEQNRFAVALLTLLLWNVLAGPAVSTAHADPLPSWKEGPVRSAIIEFVQDVTRSGGPKFVPPEERIATFDNDGTLWCEQPVVQLVFAVHRIRQMAPDHPEWKEKQPYKAILEGDLQHLLDDYLDRGHLLLDVIKTSYADIPTTEFDRTVEDFFKTVDHPQFKQPFTKTTYLPMLELLDYLRTNGFKTYICSGGGTDFMQVIAEKVYGIVPENVIGSHALSHFHNVDGRWVIMKGSETLFINDKEGKPVGIDHHIGRIPILAVGNVRSSGDIAHLTYSQTTEHPSLQILINHDDAEREFAYSEKDNASLKAAEESQWLVVSMKDDWKKVFSFE